jgi:glucose-1-phosphate thymidylyltransferase
MSAQSPIAKAEMVDRAVILARGLGTRMRADEEGALQDPAQSAAADRGVKAMIPFGRPFLDFVLSGLADAGYGQACLVIGPEHGAVREHYSRVHPRRIRIDYTIQPEPKGTADAVLAAQEFAGSHEFVVINSDNLYPLEVLRGLRELGQPGAILFDEQELLRSSNIPAERIRSFAYAKLNDEGFLADLIEKPNEVASLELRGSALVSMNCWRFSPEIFEACRRVPLSPRGEYELPLAVREAVRAGMRLKILRSTAGVLDLSRRSDISAVGERLKDIQVSL